MQTPEERPERDFGNLTRAWFDSDERMTAIDSLDDSSAGLIIGGVIVVLLIAVGFLAFV